MQFKYYESIEWGVILKKFFTAEQEAYHAAEQELGRF